MTVSQSNGAPRGASTGTEARGSGRTVTKADLVETVYEKVGLSKKESADLVELLFESLKDMLKDHGKVKLSGFGNFVVRDKKSRVGRNPQTGEAIEIEARRVLSFKPSQVLKATLNGGAAPDDDDEDTSDEA